MQVVGNIRAVSYVILFESCVSWLPKQDAAALAEAEGHMQVTGNDGGANPDDAGRAALMRAGRRLLWTLINDTVLHPKP